MSRAARACLLLGVAVAFAALAWMAFLPMVVERELHAVTGFDFRIAVLRANPFTGRVAVRGLRAGNPPGYPSPDFVEVRELRADVNMFSWLFTDRIIVNDLDLDAGTIELVRREDGTSNAGNFMAAFKHGGAPASSPAFPIPPARKPTQYLVKRLRLKLDKLVIRDYTSSKPDVKTYNLNIDHSYTDVSQLRQLLVPDVLKSLYSFGVRHDVAQLLPGELGQALGEAVGGVEQVGSKLKEATQKTGDFVKGLVDKLEHSGKP